MRLLWLGLVLSLRLSAQMPTPGNSIALYDSSAKLQLDSMARRTLRTHTEQAMCLTSYAMEDSTLVIGALRPAEHVIHADSVGMSFGGQPGAWWQPCIHSHFLGILDRASPDDNHFAALRNVFGLLLVVHPDTTWTIKGYP